VTGGKALGQGTSKPLSRLHARMKYETGMRLFLVGGSWRAIARIDMERRGYPLTVLHEYRMTPAHRGHDRLTTGRPDRIAQPLRHLRGPDDPGATGLLVLNELVKTFQPKDIAVSAYGIREGMLYEQMPPACATATL
jgi:exopolyphosphatase / guanosine-5'-triphosphate,3'-diphosphate pyrophosphatase